MAIWNKSAITNIGKEMIAASQAQGLPLNITNCKTSSYDYSEEALENITDLMQVKQTVAILDKTSVGSKVVLSSNFDNSSVVESYVFRTYGIYANFNGGDDFLLLVAITDTPDIVPSVSEGIWQTIINGTIQVSNTDLITITIDPTANATKQYVHDYINGGKDLSIPTTGWTEELDTNNKPYYTKVFNVEGIVVGDKPLGILKSEGAVDITTKKAIQKSWSQFFDYETGNGTYKILSYKIPTVSFTMTLIGTGG